MATLNEIILTLPEDSRAVLSTEIKKFDKFLGVEVSTLSAEQLSSLLSLLSTEKNQLSVKIIQQETQLEEKQKELNTQTKNILEKYGVTEISALEEKQKELEAELEKQLGLLKEALETTKGI